MEEKGWEGSAVSFPELGKEGISVVGRLERVREEDSRWERRAIARSIGVGDRPSDRAERSCYSCIVPVLRL